jgi:uncharacterized protein (DUF342 family)
LSTVGRLIMETNNIKELKSIYKKNHGKFVLELKIAPDKMKMFLDLVPHLTPVVFVDDIINILKEAFPSTIFDKRVVSDIVSLIGLGEPILNRRISVGTEPISGSDGKILLLIRPYNGIGELDQRENIKFSFNQVHLFDNVSEEKVVARLYPPKAGKDGMDVLGNIINHKAGNPVKISLDKSLVINPSDNKDDSGSSFENITAKKSGLLIHGNNQLRISEDLTIKGNVDYHTGDIDFVGRIIVNGNIQPGFRVKASKGILIKGDCQKAILHSDDGDIEIKGFCVESVLTARKNVKLNVVHQSKISAGGLLSINKESIDSVLRTEQYVKCTQGRIIGGHLFTVFGLEVKELGCEAQSTTDVIFGSTSEIHEDFSLLINKIKSYREVYNLISLQLGPYAKNPKRLILLNAGLRVKMERLYQKGQDIFEKMSKLESEQNQILSNAALENECICNIKGNLFAGVEFICRDERMSIKDLIQGPIGIQYSQDEKKFIQTTAKEINCHIEQEKKI